MKKVSLRANAKINYALEVTGVREDGYHEVRTVLQSVSLYDEVEVNLATSGFELVTWPSGVGIGAVEENTVYRVWRLLCGKVGEHLPVRVELRKKVPAGAGLGGGSADAAAALAGMNLLFGLGLSEEELREVGSKVGTDVPFCLAGGTMLGEGVGEEISNLPGPPPHFVVIAKPPQAASTAGIYHEYDRRPRARRPGSTDGVIRALKRRDLAALARSVGNDLTGVTSGLVPPVAQYRKRLLDAGALGAEMSGTGSAVYGLFRSKPEAQKAASGFAEGFAGIYEPTGRGVEIFPKR